MAAGLSKSSWDRLWSLCFSLLSGVSQEKGVQVVALPAPRGVNADPPRGGVGACVGGGPGAAPKPQVHPERRRGGESGTLSRPDGPDVARGDDSPDGVGSRCSSPSREISQPSPEPDAPNKQSPALSPGCLLTRDSASCRPMLSCDQTCQ